MKKQHNKKKKSKEKDREAALVEGSLEVTRSGLGYVIIGEDIKDVIVRPQHFNQALNGDKVAVRITKNNGSSGRQEGVIEKVLQRKQTDFIGHIELNKEFGFFIPDKGNGIPDMYIPRENLNGAEDKSRVVVRLTEWDTKSKSPRGEVLRTLDASEESNMAMQDILLDAGFTLQFDEAVMKEADAIPDIISEKEIRKRRDMRDVLTFTIDPADAKDFDDAISYKKINDNLFEIGIHIADVSHYVRPGTALDDEAYKRATSVYLPDRVLPMLPEHISNVLCSLRPNEDKLTFSAVFHINSKAEVNDVWLGRTVIHSNHRFTYEEAQEVIETGKGPQNDVILLFNKLAQKLRKQRFKKGAINFSSSEVRFILDDTGKPTGIVVKESKESHQLIEEFMLLANRTVAEKVAKIKNAIPFPYRIHDTPDEEKLAPFVAFARKFGYEFNIKTPQAIAKSFNDMLQTVNGKPEQHVLEQLGIRTMAKAAYSTDNIGHYGLGFEFYCHFTSPIRRYPDVLVHRVLQEVLNDKVIADKKMEEKCAHCSERERAAMEAERSSNKYKQVEFMQQFVGEEFEGVISGAANFGFWVETVAHKCEGLVAIQSLAEYDDFRYVEEDYALVGRRSGKAFRMGDKVHIKVVAANLGKRQLDYEWIKNETDAPSGGKKKSGREKQSTRKKKKHLG